MVIVWKRSGSTMALRISYSISGAHMVIEKQPLSPGKTPNFRKPRSPPEGGLPIREGSLRPGFRR
jgi:hypothetical protein